jgi:hypothetical protein
MVLTYDVIFLPDFFKNTLFTPVAIPDQVTKYLIFGHMTQKENTVNATPDLATLAAVITCRLLHTTHAFIFNHFQHTHAADSMYRHTIFVFVCHNSKHGTIQRPQSHFFAEIHRFLCLFIQLTDTTLTLFLFFWPMR